MKYKDFDFLDVTKHEPKDYEGKIVKVKGVHYLIGEFIGSGKERFVHKLINFESKIISHVIKIHRDQMNINYVKGLAKKIFQVLKSDVNTSQLILPTKNEFLLCNNSLFHIEPHAGAHRICNCSFVIEGKKELEKNNATLAKTLFEESLKSNANNTEALIGILLTSEEPRFDLMERILKIESNSTFYLEIILLECIFLGNSEFFSKLIKKYRHLALYDIYEAAEMNTLTLEQKELLTERRDQYKRMYSSLEEPRHIDKSDALGMVAYCAQRCYDNPNEFPELMEMMIGFANMFGQAEGYHMCLDCCAQQNNALLYLSLYQTLPSEIRLERHRNMAINSYLGLGMPEKALEELRKIHEEQEKGILEFIEKKDKFNQVNKEAFLLAEKGNLEDAYELVMKEIIDAEVSLGFRAELFKLLYGIYKNERVDVTYSALSSEEDAYWWLHFVSYKIVVEQSVDLESSMESLIKACNENMKNSKLPPSQILFPSEKVSLTYVFEKTLNVLKQYRKARKGKSNVDILILIYAKMAAAQKERLKFQKAGNE